MSITILDIGRIDYIKFVVKGRRDRVTDKVISRVTGG